MRFLEVLEAAQQGRTSFERWFGNSRVVDGAGRPLVVYHGTNQTFGRFLKKRGGMATGPQAGAKHGFFFTSDREEADDYARHAGSKVVSNVSAFEKETERLRRETNRLEQIAQRTGRQQDWVAYESAYQKWETYEIEGVQEDPAANVQVIAAYLSLQNPLEVNFNGGLKSEFGVIEDVVAKALSDGRDGVIMRNIADSPYGGRVSDQYVVFSSKQIRRVEAARLSESAQPISRQEFEAGVVDNFKRSEAEDSPWRGTVTIHHGTDSYTAQEIHQSGHFLSSEDYPSFFTTNRAEAEDYARIRARQARERRRKGATPVVISLRVPPYAVVKNSGTGEIETHTRLPLYIRGREGDLRDSDIVAAVAQWNKGDPHFDYDAYLADFVKGGEAASTMEKHRQQLDMMIPRIGPDNQPQGQVRLGDLGFWELLRTHQWLKRKRTSAYRAMRDAVYARGMQLQRERQAG